MISNRHKRFLSAFLAILSVIGILVIFIGSIYLLATDPGLFFMIVAFGLIGSILIIAIFSGLLQVIVITAEIGFSVYYNVFNKMRDKQDVENELLKLFEKTRSISERHIYKIDSSIDIDEYFKIDYDMSSGDETFYKLNEKYLRKLKLKQIL